MIRIEERLVIDLPIETVFDAERNIDLHVATQGHRGERVVGGVASGLIEEGQEVEWEAIHLGVRQRMRVRITAMRRPEFFLVEKVSGAFRTMVHEHRCRKIDGTRTEKIDIVRIEAPFGPLGWIAERLFLRAYMRKFLRRKNRALKDLIEGGKSA